ncbi:MAG: DedA family protein, partial [Paracoccaceae bacterium]
MTETLLALVPTYGIWLIFAALILSCLALPVPSSILVMTAGGFAGSEDLVLWQVQAAAFAGFMAGDQLAYAAARAGGPRLLGRFRGKGKLGAMLDKSQAMLDRRGSVAVFLSRTIFSPLGPYMAYLSGALGVSWIGFTIAAALGAACWCLAYSYLGYAFADQITQLASLIGNAVGIILALAAIVGVIVYVLRGWRAEQARLAGRESGM